MRAIRADRRRQSWWQMLLVIFLALIFGGVGTVGVLGYTEVINLGKLAFWNKPWTPPPDWVGIPVSATEIPAYTAVSREYLIPKGGTSLLLKYESPETTAELARTGVIMEFDKIRGRVTARAKRGTEFFYEWDFLPAGTRPGVAGGTPPGKQAYTLQVNKRLHGPIRDLREGDRINLLASVPVDMPGSGRSPAGKIGTVVSAPDAAMLPKRGMGVPLVQNGVVVTSLRLRDVPVATRNGAVIRANPIEEIVIAVDPREVAPLAEALDLQYEITCVVRSGRPREGEPSPAQPAGEASTAETDRQPPAAEKAQPGAVAAKAQSAAAAEKAQTGAASARAPSGDVRTAAATNARKGDDTPGYNPMAGTRLMEIMVGTQRQFVVFGAPNTSPVATSQDSGSANAGSQAQPGDGNR